MDYDRIFCFGCSWTHYKWPSWADMIRYATDKPVYNWGYRGIGNVGIMHRIMECDLANKFTERDKIIVQWSTWTREDRYLNNEWTAGGSVFFSKYYDKSFVKKYWSWNNDLIKNSTAILMANKAHNIDYQFTFYPVPDDPDFGYPADRDLNIHKLYKPQLPRIDIFPHKPSKNDFNGNGVDGHADIKAHLEFFNSKLKGKWGLDLGRKELELAVLHEAVSANLHKTQNLQVQDKIMAPIIEKFDPTINKKTLGF